MQRTTTQVQQIVSQWHKTFFFLKMEKYSCPAKISRFLLLLNTVNALLFVFLDGRALLLLPW